MTQLTAVAAAQLDASGRVTALHGPWSRLCPGLTVGALIEAYLPALHGRISGPVRLEGEELRPGLVVDVDVAVGVRGAQLLVTEREDLTARRPLAPAAAREAGSGGQLLFDLPALVGHAVLVRVDRGWFVPVGEQPSWLATVWPLTGTIASSLDAPAFLAAFLAEAEAHWDAGAPLDARSGTWSEDGQRWLEACAMGLADGRRLLMIADRGAAEHARLQRARELALRVEALMRASEEKEVLLHSIIHDLGSPIGAVLASLDAIERADSASAERLHGIAFRQAKRARKLVEDIQEVLGADVHDPIAPGQVDLAAIVRAVADDLAPRAAELARTVEVTVADEAALVPGDAGRLERVVVNLVENALRHAPHSTPVELTVRVTDDDRVELVVADRGAGVPPQILPRLFTRMLRAEDGRTGRLGLGLHFCHMVVVRAGGTIEHRPREGGGTLFRVRLPRRRRLG